MNIIVLEAITIISATAALVCSVGAVILALKIRNKHKEKRK